MIQTHRQRPSKLVNMLRFVRANPDLYLMILPVVAYFVAFHYLPMYGVQIAFRDYSVMRGIWGSRWVGLSHFKRFFESYYFSRLLRNTVSISLFQLAAGFPAPILLALMINELRNSRIKKAVQTITYAPHFLSVVVLVGMLTNFLAPNTGLINQIRAAVGWESRYFMIEPDSFKSIYVLSGVWQSAGWGSIIYMAALAGIDPTLYESARIDGANRFRILWHINIPSLLPTAIILLILNSGYIMNVGFEKVFLMQNDRILETSDVISTYVYRSGLVNSQFSFSSAVGLFNSVINCLLLLTVNAISRRVGETSLW